MREWLVTVGIVATLVLAMQFAVRIEPHWFDVLRVDRIALVERFEWWRLGSGPLVHLGFAHAALNIAGFAAVVALFARWRAPLRQLAIGASLMPCSALALVALFPAVPWMVGSSGALHALFGTLALRLAREPRVADEPLLRGPGYGVALYAGAVVKVAIEALNADASVGSSWLGARSVWEAHAAGLVVAAIAALAWSVRTKRSVAR